jgi:anti-sigma regulatory factor (Ser/Thr protein kinase)
MVKCNFDDTIICSTTEINDYVKEDSIFLFHIDECEAVKNEQLNRNQAIFLTESENEKHLGKLKEMGWSHLFIISDSPSISSTIVRRIQQIKSLLSGKKRSINNFELKCEKILSPQKIEEVADKVLHSYPPSPKLTRIRTVLVETLTNAFFYGAMNEDPTAKFTWNVDFTLDPENAVELCHGTDGKQIYLAVSDQGGKLSAETYLHWLHRQSVTGDNGLPLGIYDTHGRGLFITRKLSDHFFVTVEKGIRSECLMILEPDGEDLPHKHISILEH